MHAFSNCSPYTSKQSTSKAPLPPLAALPAEIAYPPNLSARCSIQAKLPFVHKDAARHCMKNISGFITLSDISSAHPHSYLFLFFLFFLIFPCSAWMQGDEIRKKKVGGWVLSRCAVLQLGWEMVWIILPLWGVQGKGSLC